MPGLNNNITYPLNSPPRAFCCLNLNSQIKYHRCASDVTTSTIVLYSAVTEFLVLLRLSLGKKYILMDFPTSTNHAWENSHQGLAQPLSRKSEICPAKVTRDPQTCPAKFTCPVHSNGPLSFHEYHFTFIYFTFFKLLCSGWMSIFFHISGWFLVPYPTILGLNQWRSCDNCTSGWFRTCSLLARLKLVFWWIYLSG